MATFSIRGFLKEARRRRVFRVSALYVVGAWIVLQVAALAFPAFSIPETAIGYVWVGAILGFPIALVFGWRYDVVGGQIIRTAPYGDDKGLALERADLLILSALFAVVIAITSGVGFELSQTSDRSVVSSRVRDVHPNSITILPFANMSADEENAEFLAVGIRDDLFTLLSRIGDLKIISRTSADRFEGATPNLQEIVKVLGVSKILQGSVQRAGERIHINVHLIDAVNGEHLWSEQFDREISAPNIFAIQGEISSAIVKSLQAALGPAEKVPAKLVPTKNLAAYSLYVSGRDNLYLRRLETLQESRGQFEQAIELDPDYAEAYVGLAESIVLLSTNHAAIPFAEAMQQAQEFLDKALAMNPDLADAHATIGLIKSNIWEQNRVGPENLDAVAAFERAIRLNPNSAQAYMWFAYLRTEERRFEDAIELYQRSMELDPLGRIPLSNLPALYAQRGHNEEALKIWLEATAIHPKWPVPYQMIALHLFGMGRLDEALAWDMRSEELSSDPGLGGNLIVHIYIEFEEYEKARSRLMSTPGDHPLAPIQAGLELLLDARYGESLQFISEVIDRSDNQLPPFVYSLASDIALLADDLDKAREYVMMYQPILAEDADLPIDEFTMPAVIKLAYIHQRSGQAERASEMLNAALRVVQDLPRFGMFGQGIRDVQIYSLLGRKEDALSALTEAVGAGFRSSRDWTIDQNPYLNSIRDDTRFVKIRESLRRSVAVMRDRILDAEKTGNWDDLLALAESS